MQGFRRLCKAVDQPILGSDKRQPCANGDCPVGTAVHVQPVTGALGALPCSVQGSRWKELAGNCPRQITTTHTRPAGRRRRAQGESAAGGSKDWLEGQHTEHGPPKARARTAMPAGSNTRQHTQLSGMLTTTTFKLHLPAKRCRQPAKRRH